MNRVLHYLNQIWRKTPETKSASNSGQGRMANLEHTSDPPARPESRTAMIYTPEGLSEGSGTIDTDSLIDKLIKGYTDRTRKDIDKWREAIKQAEDPYYPRREKYHQLCKDLELDTHYHSQHLVRVQATMARKYKLTIDGQEDVDKTALLLKPWFRKEMSGFC